MQPTMQQPQHGSPKAQKSQAICLTKYVVLAILPVQSVLPALKTLQMQEGNIKIRLEQESKERKADLWTICLAAHICQSTSRP